MLVRYRAYCYVSLSHRSAFAWYNARVWWTTFIAEQCFISILFWSDIHELFASSQLWPWWAEWEKQSNNPFWYRGSVTLPLVGWFILRSDRSSIHSPSLLVEELQTPCAQRFVLLSWANWKQNSLSRQLRAHSRSCASWILVYVILWSSKSWVVSWNVSPAEFPEVAVSRWLITTK